jgi:hypothetical protein
MHFWPGTMPADKEISGPINVFAPTWMYCSLKIVVGFHMMRLPSPKAPNLLPREFDGDVDAPS